MVIRAGRSQQFGNRFGTLATTEKRFSKNLVNLRLGRVNFTL